MIVKKLNTNIICVQKENGGRIEVLRPQDPDYAYWNKQWKAKQKRYYI